MTRLPNRVLPAIPLCAQTVESSPITTLCAICTWLSIFVPEPTTVDPVTARSTVDAAPISTRSPRTTLPICGILICSAPTRTNPKPSLPMMQPDCRTHSSPTTHSSSTTACGCINVRAPMRAPRPTYDPGSNRHPCPSTAPSPTITPAPIHT